jgi:hypothetical protein
LLLRLAPSLALVCFAAACSADDAGEPPPPDAGAAPDAAAPVPLREQVRIDDVSLSQAVSITLVKGGIAVAEPNGPVIANRPARIRVHVKALSAKPPVVSGELRVKRPGRDDLVLADLGKRTTRELDETNEESVLAFTVPAEELTADASISVKAGLLPTSTDVVTFPADGSALPLHARTSTQTLRVKVVPVAYEAVPGQVLTPDVTSLRGFEDALYKLYPVAKIEMSVREPIPWTAAIAANGDGWEALLSNVLATRRADRADRDLYYVGLFTPKPSFEDFCARGGCVLGLAPLALEHETGLRAAIVLGYTANAGGTMAHELAHTMGRAHAPCGAPAGVDGDFPYPAAGIGVFGFDILKKKLIDPAKYYRDMMSYCSPEWISDYTYRGIFERMEAVTKQAAAARAGGPPAETMRSFRIAAGGAVVEGPEIEVLPHPTSEHDAPVTIRYEGPNGQVVATATARSRPLSELGGRIVLAPQPPAGAVRARLDGLGTAALRPRAVVTH